MNQKINNLDYYYISLFDKCKEVEKKLDQFNEKIDQANKSADFLANTFKLNK